MKNKTQFFIVILCLDELRNAADALKPLVKESNSQKKKNALTSYLSRGIYHAKYCGSGRLLGEKFK